jgi:Domain of unknown function (DUF4124)
MTSIRNLCVASAFSMLLGVSVHAQSAYRCEINGKTVYSDTPCASAPAVAPTQDSAAQKSQADKANAQLRKDDAAVNKRIDARSNRESKERLAAMKLAAKSQKKTKAKKAKKKVGEIPRGSVRSVKTSKKSGAKKKSDNTSVSTPAKT